jgi:hypothetical protein
MELLIIPLQDKLEDWKKTVLNLDKEHAKGKRRGCFVFFLNRALSRFQAGEDRAEEAVHRHAPLAEEDAEGRGRRPAEALGVRPAGRDREAPVAGGDGEARGQGGPDRGEEQILHVRGSPQAGRGRLVQMVEAPGLI